MNTIKILSIITLLSFISCSSKKIEEKKEAIPIPLIEKAYQPKTVCD